MTFVDYYKVLGISKTATDKEVKQAYRKLARKHHPDLNPNDKNAQQKFQEINEANEVLSDIENRKKYDKYGKDWKHGEEFEKANQQQQSRRNSNSQNQQESFSARCRRSRRFGCDAGGLARAGDRDPLGRVARALAPAGADGRAHPQGGEGEIRRPS